MLEDSDIVLGGIGDEAGNSLTDQIAAHRALGWRHIELRSIDGVALADLDSGQDEEIATVLRDAGMSVPVLCSRIGNWAASIAEDLDRDIGELRRLLVLADRLGSRFIRIMSYPNDGRDQRAWADEVIRRICSLVELAARAEKTLVVENCSGWAGSSADRTLTLLGAVDTPRLRVLFDVGNPVAHGYDGFAFLDAVIPYVAHVHIKDARRDASGEHVVFCAPGDGSAQLKNCLELLVRRGYRGMWSIEPHLKLIPHLGMTAATTDLMGSYVAYGNAVQELVSQLGVPAA
jgi:L-ribulose-5-phosphate 3-epimerase